MKLIYILLFTLSTLSCAATGSKIQENEPVDITIQCLLDSMKYISALPDENYLSKGGEVSEKIIKRGDIMVPHLIEQIRDTTITKVKIADYYEYRVGDVALYLIMEFMGISSRQ